MAVVRSSLDLIVLAVRDQLATILREDTSHVRIVDGDEEFEDTVAEQYLCLWPGDEGPVDAIVMGGGRVDGRLAAMLKVWVRTRNALDATGDAESWLTDPQRGHLAFRAAIWDALLIFLPVDANGNGLCVQPLWPGRATSPRRRKKNDIEWGESLMTFTAIYEASVDQGMQ